LNRKFWGRLLRKFWPWINDSGEASTIDNDRSGSVNDSQGRINDPLYLTTSGNDRRLHFNASSTHS
jgi:hypothetical protein